MNRNDTSLEDDHEPDFSEQIEEALAEFTQTCAKSAEAHIGKGVGTKEYKDKVEAIEALGGVRDEVLELYAMIVQLQQNIAIMPHAGLLASMKSFARTRAFKALGSWAHEIAEVLEQMEDVWNDMVPTDALGRVPDIAIPAAAAATMSVAEQQKMMADRARNRTAPDA